jgi:hypothetical protein
MEKIQEKSESNIKIYLDASNQNFRMTYIRQAKNSL